MAKEKIVTELLSQSRSLQQQQQLMTAENVRLTEEQS